MGQATRRRKPRQSIDHEPGHAHSPLVRTATAYIPAIAEIDACSPLVLWLWPSHANATEESCCDRVENRKPLIPTHPLGDLTELEDTEWLVLRQGDKTYR